MHQISEKKKEKKPNTSASSLCRSIFADYLFSVVAFGATGAAGFAAAGAAGFDAAAGAFFTLSSLLRGARRSRMVIAFFGQYLVCLQVTDKLKRTVVEVILIIL